MSQLHYLTPVQRLLVMTTLCLLTLAGCSGTDEPQPAARGQLLSRNWQVQSAQYSYSNLTYTYYQKGGTANDADLSAYRFNFESSGSYTFLNDSTSFQGDWELVDQESTLRLDGQSDFSILTLSDTNFDFSFTSEETDADNKAITVQYTYRLIPAN
ncbi:hypothetical protein DYU11_19465 [Fibrisoma montanum]|uniref:Lipocalin-like domain-containing protein n=1 Tax=Fibrisoma montanum TaxID=2305895 RepID=A0A418M6X2_9BACT|nr:hypothetical protein [Fibrisoma montanum]RIV21581.1 hypothetical protein DYU11_19465 [Fibrisoma montanum]